MGAAFTLRYNEAGRPTNRASLRALQVKTEEQDVSFVKRMACSRCQISYYDTSGVGCPLCDAEQTVERLRESLTVLKNRLDISETQSAQAMRQLDLVTSMKNALDITDGSDLTFLKSVLYRWRANKGSVNVRVTHGKPTGRKKQRVAPPNGFLVQVRGGDIETHQCMSVGGTALAGYVDEAIRTGGQDMAMRQLIKALNQTLAVES